MKLLHEGAGLTAEEAYGKAVGCYGCGKREEAKDLMLRIAAEFPEYAATYNGLATIALDEGEIDSATRYVQKALQLDPSLDKALNTMGTILMRTGRIDAAIESFNRAISCNQSLAVAHVNLGMALEMRDDWAEAVAAYRGAVILRPESWQFRLHLAAALDNSGDYAGAEEEYRAVLGLNPSVTEAQVNLARIQMHRGENTNALKLLRNATERDPTYHQAWEKLCELLILTGRLHEAMEMVDRLTALGGETDETFVKRAGVLVKLGRAEDAVAEYRRGLAQFPLAHGARSSMLLTMNYSTAFSPAEIYRESLEWERIVVEEARPEGNVRRTESRNQGELRIGYVSPDFRYHPVSQFFSPLLEAHDRDSFEIFCYSDVSHPDAMTYLLQALAGNWRDIHKKDDAMVAEMIREDRIDILVDLAGHTADNRLGTFLLKPAPVQASWLGYPATTGLSVMDYRITDDIADPVGEADTVSAEKLLRLPQGFLCFAPPEFAPAVAPLPCKKNNFTTFATFNNPAKISAESVHLWSAILRNTPGSRIVLKNMIFCEEATREHFMNLFRNEGVDPKRVDLLLHTATTYSHLEAYNTIDISLDTFPYNGTTTTCESLWMGVPVITLFGDRHASRVSGSILGRIGLDELVAVSEDDYVEKACSLAADVARLQLLRKGLRKRMKTSPLCNGKGFARRIEAAYRQMWEGCS